MRMTWIDLLFAHWPVDPALLRPLLPDSVEVDTFEGEAWVGLVPFLMDDVRMARLPYVPTSKRFPECNVRTYVHVRGQPERHGVWFFSLDASSILAVRMARRFWRLNYLYGKLSIQRQGDVVHYSVARRDPPTARMQCAWRIGNALPHSRPGELRHFLTERYTLYSIDDKRRLREGLIWHQPWPLREAELISLDDELVRAAGVRVDTTQPPIVWHADRLDVQAWPMQFVT